MPLFSLASHRSWGIGEFADLPQFARWAREAGQAALQILPINEMPPAERSPYSAMTAMALDPLYLSLPDVPDFGGLGGVTAFDAADQAALAAIQQSDRVRYVAIRALKEKWLRRSWDRFLRMEVARGTQRSARFDRFCADEAWWLDDYALFRALHARHDERQWQDWPAPLARCEPTAVAQARAALHVEATYRKYLQWLAAEQWAEAKRLAWPTRVLGDLPFMISADSPDVWARQAEFRFDATVGVPPDAFSETGQDWGLPPWRHEVMAANDFAWMRMRARRYAALFDGFRIDHLVGLYRTYIRPIDQAVPAFFEPADEPAQIALGETLVNVLRSGGGPYVIAEDLGVIPPSCASRWRACRCPGLKVLRWERHWDRADAAADRSARVPGALGGHHGHPRHRAAGGHARRRDRGRPRGGAGVAPVGRVGAHAHPAAGRIRLDRAHQHARGGGRGELDVAPALAGGHVARPRRHHRPAPIGSRHSRARRVADSAGRADLRDLKGTRRGETSVPPTGGFPQAAIRGIPRLRPQPVIPQHDAASCRFRFAGPQLASTDRLGGSPTEVNP